MHACQHCGEQVTSRTVDKYSYAESGLDHLVLINLEERSCPKCHEPAVVIPKLSDLHRAVGVALASKPSLLTGKEIGFIRKLLGLSEPEFALRLYSSPQDVIYWEKEDICSWAATDRLIRTLLIIKGKFQGFWPVQEYEQVDEMLATVNAQRAPQCELEAAFDPSPAAVIAHQGKWIVRQLNAD
jgi:DNA-binding transcriptional regulator YiaG